MALQNSGQISINDVNVELGTTGKRQLAETTSRDLCDVAGGQVKLSDFYGKSNVSYMVATGGTVTTDGDYQVHTFTSSGSFVVSNVGDQGGSVEYFVVGGGSGGRGDGGNMTSGSGSISLNSYSISVGSGGSHGSSPSNLTGGPGYPSSFDSIASATGATGHTGKGGSLNGGAHGAVSSASNAGASNPTARGGPGQQSSITGVSTYYGGGGGGTWHNPYTGDVGYAPGGTGGGGNGFVRPGGYWCTSPSGCSSGGAGGKGGGGGEGYQTGYAGVGASGGSGVVIIRYQFQ